MWTCCTLFASHRGIKLWPKPPFLLCWKELGLHEKLFSQVLQLYRFQLLAYTIEVFPISFAIKDFFYQSKPNFQLPPSRFLSTLPVHSRAQFLFFFPQKLIFFIFLFIFQNCKQTQNKPLSELQIAVCSSPPVFLLIPLCLQKDLLKVNFSGVLITY